MRVAVGVLGAAFLVAGFPAAKMGDGTILAFPETPAIAQSGGLSEAGFQAYLPRLRAEAERGGVSRATIDRVFPDLEFSARTIELDRAQPGGSAGLTSV